MQNSHLDDEIIIGINRPKEKQKKNKNTKVAKKAALPKKKKKDKNKKQNKKRKLKIFMFLFFIVIVALIIFLLNSTWFKITKIEIINSNKVSKEEVEVLINAEEYKNIFWVNSRKIEKNIKNTFAYVEEVKISRKLPNTLLITLEERQPRYMLQFADSYVYINNQGYMLEVTSENINLPIILGFKTDLTNIEVRK